MSTLSDLQKKLQQESEGIMFPFRTATVSTTQPVLDTATDGIMSITGQKYIGPDSVIQYSPEGQRQLKEIEKGMLPQFDQTQFPDIGKGKVEDRGGAAPLPVDTTPLPQPEAPMMDPCPPGFKYDPIKKICVPVEKSKDRDDRTTFTGRTPDFSDAYSQLSDAIQEQGGLYPDGVYKPTSNILIDNSTFLKNFGFIGSIVDKFLFKDPADKAFLKTFGFNQETKSYGVDGVAAFRRDDGKIEAIFTEEGKKNTDDLATRKSLAGELPSTRKDDGGIVGPIRVGVFGTTDRAAGFGDQREKPQTRITQRKPDPKTFASIRESLMRDRSKTPVGTTKPGTKTTLPTPKIDIRFGPPR